MISLNEIEEAIEDLTQEGTSFTNCAKLADLYIVRDHLKEVQPQSDTVTKVQEPHTVGNSEFLKAVDKIISEDAWDIMNELMDVLKVSNPGLYEGVMMRIKIK